MVCDVANQGTTFATATALAVGDSGLVLEGRGSQSGFVPALASGSLAIDLSAVAVSPSGNTVLVGGKYDTDLSTADDKGFMLRCDADGWDTIRAHTGKDIAGISLSSDTFGYVVGQTMGKLASFINGNLASSVLLRYIAN